MHACRAFDDNRGDGVGAGDGSEAGEFTDESFTAAAADVTIHGIEVHPGMATGKLVNAARLAGRVLAALPQDRLTPESTSEREGFIHVYAVEATAGRATIRTIVRDFEDDRAQSSRRPAPELRCRSRFRGVSCVPRTS